MDIQGQFVAINVSNISPTAFRKKKDVKFLGKTKASAKVLFTIVAKEWALY